MANIKSAKKRILQSQRRAEINRFRLSRIRTGIKNYESTISAGKKTTIKENFLKLEAEIAKLAYSARNKYIGDPHFSEINHRLFLNDVFP